MTENVAAGTTDMPTNGSTENGTAPHIADTSYRGYDGPLNAPLLRWWVVAWATIRNNIGRKRIGFWIIAGFILLVYLVQGVIFYVTNLASQNFGVELNNQSRPYAATIFQAQASIEIWIFAAVLTVGAASIAADNKANALLVYLSKPLTRWDYLIGKWMGVFLLLFALTFIPNLFLYLFFLGTYYNDGFLQQEPWLFGKIFVGSLLSPAIHTSVMLGISAWTKSPRLAGAAYAALFFILGIALDNVARVISAGDKDYQKGATLALVRNAGIDGLGSGISQTLYDVDPMQVIMQRRSQRRARGRRNTQNNPTTPERPLTEREERALRELERPPLSPLLLLGALYVVLPLSAAAVRIRAVEIVKG